MTPATAIRLATILATQTGMTHVVCALGTQLAVVPATAVPVHYRVLEVVSAVS